jgi:hypothetical protein
MGGDGSRQSKSGDLENELECSFSSVVVLVEIMQDVFNVAKGGYPFMSR